MRRQVEVSLNRAGFCTQAATDTSGRCEGRSHPHDTPGAPDQPFRHEKQVAPAGTSNDGTDRVAEQLGLAAAHQIGDAAWIDPQDPHKAWSSAKGSADAAEKPSGISRPLAGPCPSMPMTASASVQQGGITSQSAHAAVDRKFWVWGIGGAGRSWHSPGVP